MYRWCFFSLSLILVVSIQCSAAELAPLPGSDCSYWPEQEMKFTYLGSHLGEAGLWDPTNPLFDVNFQVIPAQLISDFSIKTWTVSVYSTCREQFEAKKSFTAYYRHIISGSCTPHVFRAPEFMESGCQL